MFLKSSCFDKSSSAFSDRPEPGRRSLPKLYPFKLSRGGPEGGNFKVKEQMKHFTAFFKHRRLIIGRASGCHAVLNNQ